MVKLQWTINGHRVSADRIAEEFAKAAHAEIDTVVKARIASVTCPVHHQRPGNIHGRRISGSDRVNFEYEVCCERLRETVEESFR